MSSAHSSARPLWSSFQNASIRSNGHWESGPLLELLLVSIIFLQYSPPICIHSPTSPTCHHRAFTDVCAVTWLAELGGSTLIDSCKIVNAKFFLWVFVSHQQRKNTVLRVQDSSCNVSILIVHFPNKLQRLHQNGIGRTRGTYGISKKVATCSTGQQNPL